MILASQRTLVVQVQTWWIHPQNGLMVQHQSFRVHFCWLYGNSFFCHPCKFTPSISASVWRLLSTETLVHIASFKNLFWPDSSAFDTRTTTRLSQSTFIQANLSNLIFYTWLPCIYCVAPLPPPPAAGLIASMLQFSSQQNTLTVFPARCRSRIWRSLRN